MAVHKRNVAARVEFPPAALEQPAPERRTKEQVQPAATEVPRPANGTPSAFWSWAAPESGAKPPSSESKRTADTYWSWAAR